ncbi:MAG: hypothetical protein JWM53_4754, partial [bacterium]|nr:hypothetical protein [bacterium]
MKDETRERLPWNLYAAECVGTALLVGIGLSLVIIFGGEKSPVVRLVP